MRVSAFIAIDMAVPSTALFRIEATKVRLQQLEFLGVALRFKPQTYVSTPPLPIAEAVHLQELGDPLGEGTVLRERNERPLLGVARRCELWKPRLTQELGLLVDEHRAVGGAEFGDQRKVALNLAAHRLGQFPHRGDHRCGVSIGKFVPRHVDDDVVRTEVLSEEQVADLPAKALRRVLTAHKEALHAEDRATAA